MLKYMNYQSERPLQVYREEDPERETARLRAEIADLAYGVGAELSEDELRVAAEGVPKQPELRTEEERREAENRKEQGEAYVPFKLLERAARCGARAQDAPEGSDERRRAGGQNLVLTAAGYLRAHPDLAQKCVEYAQAIKEGSREWDEREIPRLAPGEEQESLRRAA